TRFSRDWSSDVCSSDLDICEVVVERPAFQEMTALGAAKLAALGVGLIADLEDHPAEAPARWSPRMGKEARERLLKGWRGAVRARSEERRVGKEGRTRW